ncbi:MAG: rhomboid family intramembrane serine protease [Treponema sp.]|jgi:membrane associated rhomboid family serine protease|nr:rhomboid family intramembrane serine protease [Treponema sp.]
MNIIKHPFRYRNDGVVYWLIGINVLIFILTQFSGWEFRRFLILHLSMIPDMVKQGWVWTFVSYMFLHGGFSHIFFNMLGLFIFGTQVERQMGSREFLLFYFVTGSLAGVFSFTVYCLTGADAVILMGASGALFAVELAYAVFFPDSIIYLWGILPLRAPVMVLGFTALELFFSVTGMNSGVAHFTHLAGFGFGWLYFLLRFDMDPLRRLTGR